MFLNKLANLDCQEYSLYEKNKLKFLNYVLKLMLQLEISHKFARK